MKFSFIGFFLCMATGESKSFVKIDSIKAARFSKIDQLLLKCFVCSS